MNKELLLFIHFFWYGAVLAVLYDCICIFRKIIHHPSWMTAYEDIFFWTGSSIYLFTRFFEENSGILRAYLFIGILFGAAAWRVGISDIYISFMVKACTLILKPLIRLKQLKLYNRRCKIFVNRHGHKRRGTNKKNVKVVCETCTGEQRMKEKKKTKKRRMRHQDHAGMMIITAMVCILVVVLVAMSHSLEVRTAVNDAKIQQLGEKIQQENERTDQIDAMKEYMESDEFLIKKAHDIGLVKDNEIIFKENR